MEECIPTSIKPLIDAYLHVLEPLRSHSTVSTSSALSPSVPLKSRKATSIL